MLEPQILAASETRTVLEGVRWQVYLELAQARRGSIPRMVYDEGVLEMMNPLLQHENIGGLIGRMVETYSEVKEIDIQTIASTTIQRSDLEKGYEADESYYVTHAEQIRSKRELDMAIDPPPDLVIEVEITSSAIKKMKLFAKIGIPEVWRHNGIKLSMFRLINDRYISISSSQELPGLNPDTIDNYLSQRFEMSETRLIRLFRESLATL